jgi:MerR family transcriptional regulator, light-induced transcriptional regulator
VTLLRAPARKGVSLASDPQSVLTVGAVAHRLGVAVPTLRSWDRRYGLRPSAHSAGGHRRYTPDDLERLRRMVALVGDGVPPAAAARVALGEERRPRPRRHGGGSGAIAVGRAQQAVRGLSREASRLDVDGVHRRVATHFTEHGVAVAWTDLLVPLLQSLGHAYDRTPERIVPIEHAASAGILGALHARPFATERGRIPAMLACAPDEQHSLPLEALRAALAERKVAARFLGPRLPADTLRDSVVRLQPTTVVVWAHSAALARRVPLAEVAESCSRLLVAGPGWSNVRAARGYDQPSSLDEAVDEVLGTAVPTTRP